MLVIIAHYNTNRLSPFGVTWREKIFESVSQFSNHKVLFVDWMSNDGSDKTTEAECKKLGYDFRSVNKSQNYIWTQFFKKTLRILRSYNEKNILYIEADTWIIGDNAQLDMAMNLMKKHKLAAINLTRMDNNGLRAVPVKRKIDDGYILRKGKIARKIIRLPRRESKLVSTRRNLRLLWNVWDTKCYLFNMPSMLQAAKKFNWYPWSRHPRKKGFFRFGALFTSMYEVGAIDYIFCYNYGQDCNNMNYHQKAIEICDKYANSKLSEIAESVYMF